MEAERFGEHPVGTQTRRISEYSNATKSDPLTDVENVSAFRAWEGESGGVAWMQRRAETRLECAGPPRGVLRRPPAPGPHTAARGTLLQIPSSQKQLLRRGRQMSFFRCVYYPRRFECPALERSVPGIGARGFAVAAARRL